MWRVANENLGGGLGVRPRLSLLVLSTIAPLFALLLIGLVTDRHLAIRTARTQAIDLAQLIAERQADSLQQARELLLVLRRSPDIVENPENCHDTLKAIASDQPQFHSFGIVQSDGMIICNSVTAEPAPFSDKGFVDEVMASRSSAFTISKFRVGRITGKPTIFVGIQLVPGIASAAGAGMIYVSLNLDRFATVANQFVGSENWSVVVAETRTGTILARSPAENFLVGKSFAGHPLMKAMLEHPEGGWVEAEGFMGLDRIFGYAPLPSAEGGRLAVAVGLSRSIVLAEANHRMLLGLTIALIVGICAACGTWFLADLWQVRPIQALVRAARKLGKGDLSARVEIASWQAPEFRALGSTLNEMAKNIDVFQKLLGEREAQFRLLAENATDFVYKLDLNLIRTYISPSCLEILGFTQDELLGTSPLEMINPDDVEAIKAVFKSMIQGDLERASLTYRLRHRDGHWIWVHSELRMLRDPQTMQPIGFQGAIRDISAVKAAEEAVRDSEARYRLLAENAVDLIICLNLDLRPTYVSPSAHQLLGCDPADVASGTLEDFALPEDRPLLNKALRLLQEKGALVDFRFRIHQRMGNVRWLEMSGRRPLGDESIILVLHDITIRQQAEDRLEEANNQLRDLAEHDFLTGLANRRALDRFLDTEFRRAMRNGSSLALIMIDVDRFKAYNDFYGHPAGDVCLQKIALAIKSVLQRPSDLAARYGGEEIAILLPDTNEAGAQVVAERVRVSVADLQIKHKGGVDQIATISVGVAAIVPGAKLKTPAALLGAADEALYAAKAAGRNRVELASQLGTRTSLPPRRRPDNVKLG